MDGKLESDLLGRIESDLDENNLRPVREVPMTGFSQPLTLPVVDRELSSWRRGLEISDVCGRLDPISGTMTEHGDNQNQNDQA
ncbi:hypothetical protein N7510_003890 [Penicillium lagena]|uniref:uncharacterized protein n=1 Tax=Penicillium lagena TaxID=94218 RepID=UPI002541E47E|nr:uncharacterized protein N7510_003890 [Penicillium lagena]KAJ5619906.1 hypothetical protein N7510_003890 [Penicillium lagena]